MVSKAMQDEGYEIIPVNPTIDEALGVKAVACCSERLNTFTISIGPSTSFNEATALTPSASSIVGDAKSFKIRD
jgi:hypothetical protein